MGGPPPPCVSQGKYTHAAAAMADKGGKLNGKGVANGAMKSPMSEQSTNRRMNKMGREASKMSKQEANKADKTKIARELVINPEEVHVDPKEMELLKVQFQVFDQDNSGYIDAEEFISLCTKVGLQEQTALAIVAEIDDDQDGKISFDEFMGHRVLNHITDALRQQKKEKNLSIADQESRTHVNIGRIVDIVRAKMDNSKLALSFMRHIAFLAIYSFVIIAQRAPKDAMSMRAGLKNYFVGSSYRVPDGYELKTWMDIRSLDELWDWQQLHFANLFHLETYYNGDPLSRADRGSVLQHLRMTSGFRLVQRRSKNGTCASYPVYSDFADDCYSDLYLDGLVRDTQIYAFICTRTHTCTHTSTLLHTHVRKRARTHTHTLTLSTHTPGRASI